MAKRLTKAEKERRVQRTKVESAAARAAGVRRATTKVKARTSIDFVRSVRGR